MTKEVKRYKKILHSLYIRLILVITFCLGISVVAFFTGRYIGNRYIDKVYISEERKTTREEARIEELRDYVSENELSSEDTDQIARWSKENRYVYLLIYKNDELFFSSDMKPGSPQKPIFGDGVAEGGEEGEEGEVKDEAGESKPEPDDSDESYGSGITVQFPTREELRKYAEENGLYELEMSDGVLLASIAEFSEYFYYDLVNILSLVFAMILLATGLILYFRRILSRIKKLDRSVMVVASGNINTPIEYKGYDEIARLSGNVENMRCSILQGIEEERLARQANTELITAMSHDIRTPLTVLLGYLDVMKSSSKDENMLGYVEASEKTALRLKNLSDDLFNYFLAFGSTKENLELDEYDAETLFEQIISEQTLLLAEGGYDVRLTVGEGKNPSATVVTDAPKLTRIVDNLFSNLKKYSDKEQPIEIFARYGDDSFTLEIINYIAPNTHAVESNGIGLKTCARLAVLLGGSFEYSDLGKRFRSVLTIKLSTGEKEK